MTPRSDAIRTKNLIVAETVKCAFRWNACAMAKTTAGIGPMNPKSVVESTSVARIYWRKSPDVTNSVSIYPLATNVPVKKAINSWETQLAKVRFLFP